jgi:ATP-binding cassette subfamily B protein
VGTEEQILRNLRETRGARTELVSSHRISSVLDSDRIFVLDHGVITQAGTHSELLSQRFSHYWKFYEQQRMKEDLTQFSESLALGEGEVPCP